MTLALALAATASSLSLISLGGGFYEVSVVDPAWPSRPQLIQPKNGGVSRARFWIAAHVAFELTLIAAIVAGWQNPDLRFWLIVAFASHAVMRIWSAFDFIPKALAFEKADPTESAWTRRSRLRLPLDLVTCCAMLAAFSAAVDAA